MTDFRFRDFTLADGPAVGALTEWAWWPTRSQAGWAWMMQGSLPQGPVGWVGERDGEIVAFVGNFIQRFTHRGDDFAGVTGHSLLVRPDAGGASRGLLRRFVSQQDVFALYTFNANAISAGHYHHYGMHAWPEGQSRVKYAWRIDPLAVLTERVLWKVSRTRGFEGVRGAGERFSRARLWNDDLGPLEAGVRAVSPGAIGAAFDRLWQRLSQEGRLLSWRDAATLSWRCADPDLTRAPILLAYDADGEMAGYLLAFFAKQTEIDQPSLEIVDLIAMRDHEARAVPALIRSLNRAARSLGVARVRMSMVNPRMEPLVAAVPGARRLEGHVHVHARFRSEADRARAEDWHATPYDGDYSFCVRAPPRPVAARLDEPEWEVRAARSLRQTG
jgi:hypothetical protein